MDEAEIKEFISREAKKHNIDKPIMSHKVIGNRIELHLYGGSTEYLLMYEAPAQPSHLSALTKAQLVDLAKERDIKVTTKMTKAQLIKAIEKAK